MILIGNVIGNIINNLHILKRHLHWTYLDSCIHSQHSCYTSYPSFLDFSSLTTTDTLTDNKNNMVFLLIWADHKSFLNLRGGGILLNFSYFYFCCKFFLLPWFFNFAVILLICRDIFYFCREFLKFCRVILKFCRELFLFCHVLFLFCRGSYGLRWLSSATAKSNFSRQK